MKLSAKISMMALMAMFAFTVPAQAERIGGVSAMSSTDGNTELRRGGSQFGELRSNGDVYIGGSCKRWARYALTAISMRMAAASARFVLMAKCARVAAR